MSNGNHRIYINAVVMLGARVHSRGPWADVEMGAYS